MARKQAVIIKCDGNGCKTVAEVQDIKETPTGWYRVQPSRHGRFSDDSSFDMCSLDCVSKWARARKQVEIAEDTPEFQLDEKTGLLEHERDEEDEPATDLQPPPIPAEFLHGPSAQSNNGHAKTPGTIKDKVIEVMSLEPERQYIGSEIAALVIDFFGEHKTSSIYKAIREVIDDGRVFVTTGKAGSGTNPQRYKLVKEEV